MLIAAKSSLTNLIKSSRQKHNLEIFEGKYYSDQYQQLSFKYFVKSFLTPKLLPRVSAIKTTIANVTLKVLMGH